jgi:hypothetical protein
MIASMDASQIFLKTNPGPTNYQLGAAFFFFFWGLIFTIWRISFQKMKKKGFFGGFFSPFLEK